MGKLRRRQGDCPFFAGVSWDECTADARIFAQITDATIIRMPQRPDIIVVGAGIVGCAIAHELARRGASVHVVEARAPGMGATQAAAGILAPHIEAGSSTVLLSLAVRSLGLFDDFVARVREDSGLDVVYRRTGTLQVAVNDEAMSELRNAAARLDAQHVRFTLVDADTIRREEPHLSHSVTGGLVVPSHGFVVAGMLVRALAAAAGRRGVQFIEGRHVKRIAPSNGTVVVETDRGDLEAGAVIVAAGSWSSRIEITGMAAYPPIRPVRGQLLRLAWKDFGLRRVVWSDRCYVVPWDDDTMLVGATVEEAGFDERTTVAAVHDLIEAAAEMFPGAWTAGFVEARAGLRPASSDLLPVIGRSIRYPNVMYATGHYRNGILLAPLTAVLVADAMLDKQTDSALSGVSPQRFGEL
jgi:glycine oxidase